METKVTLKSLHEEKPFSISHAQRIMDLQKNDKVKGWQLADTNFELKNGIITKRYKGGDTNSQTKKRNR